MWSDKNKGAHWRRVGQRAAWLTCGLLVANFGHLQAQVSESDVKDLTPAGPGKMYGQPPPDARPPSADPHDLNGFYEGLPNADTPLNAAIIAPSPAGAPIVEANLGCTPRASIPFGNSASQIVQTPGRVSLIAENNHLLRSVFLDRKFPASLEPSYMGYSIGHWEGDTLVVETRGLRSADFAGPKLASITRTVERLRKIDGGLKLQIVATIEGADRDGKPASTTKTSTARWRPDMHLLEVVCEEGAALFFTK